MREQVIKVFFWAVKCLGSWFKNLVRPNREAELVNEVVILEWNFTPENYFEDDFQVVCEDYELSFKAGKIEAQIDATIYNQRPDMRDKLHQSVKDRFSGAQIFSHTPFELSDSTMYKLHPDGRKDTTVFVNSEEIKISAGNIDISIKDNTGNIISDSRHDRIEAKKKLANLAGDHACNDTVATSLLGSYGKAVRDPDNELVYLYEILDSLKKRFRGQKNACQELGESLKDWSRLGKLANSEPLKQGRHRGQNAGTLRDATEEELIEARDIAKRFIEAYLNYLR